MKFAVFLFLLVTSLLSPPLYAKNSQHEIIILGLVSGRAVSDRQVKIDLVLENPVLYKTLGISFVTKELLLSGLNRVMTQLMILEELKVIGDSKMDGKELEAQLSLLKKRLGPQGWKNFSDEFDISEPMVRERLSEKLQVERAIDERMKLVLTTQSPENSKKRGASQEELVKKSIEEWMTQLKSRYRMQVFRYKK
jgi:hypothetical protein